MSQADAALSAAHAEVKAELARTDTKASLLLAFTGAGLAGVWTVASNAHLHPVALVTGGAGVAVLLAVVALLLRAVRPNLGGGSGFPKWATLTPEQIRTTLAEDGRAEDIANLSRIAVNKFARLQRAIDLTYAAGALLLVAATIAVVGGA
ncbi:Pycsar system effector family protein [Streptomyces ficellus]|uniref:Integral membrane plasmid transfer protein n=1 Tax=Streptomyces ficellus TaxID=1977088 RepID=A0A6I6FFC9_9ACTN|nr:Pycsar system effector family protein [Streptomyces ficellus]QGV79777.1 integral membrane plasmid transfer protein [Streptomyces ficellus]